MSVLLSVFLQEKWSLEYKPRARAKTLILWSSSIDLVMLCSSPDAISINPNYLCEYKNNFSGCAGQLATSFSLIGCNREEQATSCGQSQPSVPECCWAKEPAVKGPTYIPTDSGHHPDFSFLQECSDKEKISWFVMKLKNSKYCLSPNGHISLLEFQLCCFRNALFALSFWHQ